MTVSKLAALSILGGMIGAHLGRSAIGEINPSYFSAPETSFHADLAPNRAFDWVQAPTPQYRDASLIQGLGSGCVGCRDHPEEYQPIHDAAVEDFGGEGPSPAEYEAVEESVASLASAHGGRRIAPYAHYAITIEVKKEGAKAVVADPGEPLLADANPDPGSDAPQDRSPP